jgi:uncharacterized protein YjbI with pentapeptide repeats
VEIVEHRKDRLEDKELKGEVVESFERKELVRVFAVNITFKDVVFKQAVLTNCYFRNCTFIRCDFTGAQIKECYLKGSSFEACQFRYSAWEKTQLDEEFLDRCLPSEENLARDLVRSLRVNFSQIGNYDAVNNAAAIEVRLTGQHLFNAAYSRQTYYRSFPKYNGVRRLWYIWQHFRWKTLDYLWGNGESLFRVLLSGVLVIMLSAMLLATATANLKFADALSLSFLSFWGIAQPLPEAFAVSLIVARFFLFGLFMAILVKRLSRR